MKKILVLLLLFSFIVPAYSKNKPQESIIVPMTQLEKRQYQTKIYTDNDKTNAMKSLLNTFQDEGYIVYNVNSLLGFIYAVKDFDSRDPNVDISKEFGYTNARLHYNGVKIATIEACANIMEYDNKVRVRINFKRKLLNEYGNAQFIDDVQNSQFYEDFYSKLDTAVNLQKQIKSIKTSESVNVEANDKTNVEDSVQSVSDLKSEDKDIVNSKVTEETKEENTEVNTSDEQQINLEEDNNIENEIPISKKEIREQKKLEKALEKEQKIQLKLEQKRAKEEAKMLKRIEKSVKE